jgi:putative endonuclease
MFARALCVIVNFAARKGLAESGAEHSAEIPSTQHRKQSARPTGVRGETYASWYLRRHGYVLVARNYTMLGMKGEIDMIGFDGEVLAFIEVETRAATDRDRPTPEEAMNAKKHGHLTRMGRQFLRTRRMDSASCRFDVLVIETGTRTRPVIRLPKGAFVPDSSAHHSNVQGSKWVA